MQERTPENKGEKREAFDLTSGPVVRAIWTLALPTILASTAQTTITLVDTLWVGRLGSDSIAAVGMSGQGLFLLYTVFMGISTASMAMVSRAVGAKDFRAADFAAAQSLLLTFVLATATGVLGYVFAPELLGLLYASDEVARLGTGYLRVSFLGAIPMFALFVGSGILRGAGDARTPLAIVAVAAVVNLVLDPILIFGLFGLPAMGVKGAALASVIAETVAFTIGLVLLTSGRLRVRLHLRDFRIDPGTIWQITKIGIPASVQMSLRALMGLVLMGLVAKFGMEFVAAFTVGMRLQMIAFMPTFGLASASAALVGQNLGAGKPERAERSALISAGFALLIMGSLAFVFSILAPRLMGVFSDEAPVIDAGTFLLRISAPGLVAAAIGIVLSRSIAGAGDTLPPMIFTCIALWALQVPLAFYLSSIPALGETGVWWANVIAGFVLMSMTSAYFFSGRWKRKMVSY